MICGPCGVGKTHLARSIVNRFNIAYPGRKSIYVTAEQYVTELISSLKYSNPSEFLAKYRGCDLLVVDEISFFKLREQSQKDLQYTIKTLLIAGKQVVATSSHYPNQIGGIEEAIVSLFQGGLIVDLPQPDYNQRMKIAEAVARKRGISIPCETLHFICERSQGSVRAIEGAILRLDAYARFSGSNITPKIALSFLAHLSKSANNSACRRVALKFKMLAKEHVFRSG